MGEWREYTLDKVYDFGSGLSKSADQFGFGHGFVGFKDVFYNYFLPDQLTQLVNSTEKERATCSVKAGDVFLTRTSETQDELGMSSVALKDYPNATFNGFTKRLRPKGDVEVVPEYSAYYFRSSLFRRNVTSMSSITTRASLNNEMLSALTIRLPKPNEQRAIGSCLKSLDAKIDLLHRQNKTLEAMAETLFRQWFVEEAEEGWVQGSVSDLCTVVDFVANGSFASLKANVQLYDEPEFALFVRTTDYTGGFTGNLKYTDKESFDFLKKSRLHGNEVIISNVGNTGTVFRPPVWLGLPMTLGSNAVALLSEGKTEFLYYYFSSEPGQGALESIVTGSAQPKFNKTNLRDLEMVIPPDGVIQRFEQFAKPIREATVSRNIQIRTLTALRDTLLPKLMSGEVRVVVESKAE